MSERVILAYSGGLDTSVAISWIGKETGREVVAVAIDLGQGGEDMEVVRQRALDCGAVEAVVRVVQPAIAHRLRPRAGEHTHAARRDVAPAHAVRRVPEDGLLLERPHGFRRRRGVPQDRQPEEAGCLRRRGLLLGWRS